MWYKTDDNKKIDLLILAILSHYGGVYINFSLILTRDFDWLFDLKNNNDVVNKFGEEPDVFYVYPRHSDQSKYLDPLTNQQVLLYPNIELSMFFGAKRNAKILFEILSFFVDTMIKNYPKSK